MTEAGRGEAAVPIGQGSDARANRGVDDRTVRPFANAYGMSVSREDL